MHLRNPSHVLHLPPCKAFAQGLLAVRCLCGMMVDGMLLGWWIGFEVVEPGCSSWLRQDHATPAWPEETPAAAQGGGSCVRSDLVDDHDLRST